MRKSLSLITSILLLINTGIFAQIISPDTVCANSPVLFKTPYSAITYGWIFDTVNVNQSNTTFATAYSGGPVSDPTFTVVCNDNGSYHSFTTNYVNNAVTRLDFGTNPNSTPTATNLGTFGMTSGITEGIDIVKDSATNNWYGLVVSGSDMVFLNFGSSLTNTPTSTLTTYSTNLYWPHQVTIKKYGANWIAFIANRNAGMTRFDFGTSLTNTPTVTNLPLVGGIQNPCNFCIYQENGTWYMLVTNLIPGTITRLNFGGNLMNNNPNGVNMGNPNNLLNIPRSVNIIPDCNQLVAYLFNENGQETKLDFGGSILNTPVITNLGNNINSTTNGTYPYLYSGTYYLVLSECVLNSILRYPIINLPSANVCNYYIDSTFHTFTQSGVYNITLYCDQANSFGVGDFCKQIVVLDSFAPKITDTALCGKPAMVLHDSANGGNYNWNNGDTTANISITLPGTYWVHIGGTTCSRVDTFHVIAGQVPLVDLGNDTTLCVGHTITLASSGSYTGPAYLWSTMATSATINVSTSGKYSLTITEGQCKGSDTVNVQFKPAPSINLGNDTSICQNFSLTLRSLQPSGTQYLWSNGSTADSLSVSSGGIYWLQVSEYGCSTSDSIVLTQIFSPRIKLTDSTLCFEDALVLPLFSDSNCFHCSYLWSDGSTKNTLQITQEGIYYLSVENICGSASDTAHIKYEPCNLWFPNAFTPNGDTKNDIARVVGNLQGITDFTLAIYNRWGQRVFFTHDRYTGWDGVFNGTPQPIGAFDYMVIYTFRGKQHLLKGTIDLIR